MFFTHYVFSAAINNPANTKSIKLAKGVINELKRNWELEADIVLWNYHSTITIIENHDNIEIKFENNNIIQLINDCMEFAKLKERFDRMYSTLSVSDIE